MKKLKLFLAMALLFTAFSGATALSVEAADLNGSTAAASAQTPNAVLAFLNNNNNSNGITGFMTDLTKTLYNDWRPIITFLALLIAVIMYLVSDQKGKSMAIKIGVVVVILALIPTIYRQLTAWTGSSSISFTNANLNP